ncbi:hypothetical protein [Rhodococcus sp. A14]|uniref:hypothetical protein n=1 Tax=Rhodococcus sp. A14 TaxID=1194106 RepID=UPI00141D7691|nr:hypothetical protein [Rhodococcus sp. A14]
MYSTKQARYEYIVTDKGRDHARSSWPCTFGGPRTRRTARNVVLVDQVTGSEIVPEFVDHYSGRPLSSMRAEFVAGPDASEDMRRRLDPDRRACPAGPPQRSKLAKTLGHPHGGCGE